MKRATFGELDGILAGGSDGDGGGEGRLVVLMHGYGAPGDDLVDLAPVLQCGPSVRFFFPQAPIDLSPMGLYGSRAWWHIDPVAVQRAIETGVPRNLAASVPEGMPKARALVIGMLDAIDAALAPDSLVLGGFSQGAMLSCDVALHDTRPLSGLALLSGAFVSEAEWTPRMAARAGLRGMQSHGRQDPLLPFDEAERLNGTLSDAGVSLDWVPFHGQHEIPPSALQALRAVVVG